MIFNRPRAANKKSTWVFDSKIRSKKVSDGSFAARFTCGNATYTGIGYQFALVKYSIKYLSDSGSVSVYSDEWKEEAYRTITFEEEPTGDLLTWLQANATPQ